MAKLPPVIACIVAEQVRPEPNNKSTILGFVGVSPIAQITVPSTPTTIQLALIVLCEEVREPGDFEVEVTISTSDGKTLLPRTAVQGNDHTAVGRRAFYTINFQGLPVLGPETYAVMIYSMQELHSTQYFSVIVTPNAI